MNSSILFLTKINTSYFIVIGFSITQILNFIMISIAPSGSNLNDNGNVMQIDYLIVEGINLIIIAPILETFLFQLIPFFLLKRILKGANRFLVYVILSSSLFALDHLYNVYYFITIFLVGIVLAIWFYISKMRDQNAFFIVFVIHATNNFISFILSNFLN